MAVALACDFTKIHQLGFPEKCILNKDGVARQQSLPAKEPSLLLYMTQGMLVDSKSSQGNDFQNPDDTQGTLVSTTRMGQRIDFGRPKSVWVIPSDTQVEPRGHPRRKSKHSTTQQFKNSQKIIPNQPKNVHFAWEVSKKYRKRLDLNLCSQGGFQPTSGHLPTKDGGASTWGTPNSQIAST